MKGVYQKMNNIYLELARELEKKLKRPLKEDEIRFVNWMIKKNSKAKKTQKN